MFKKILLDGVETNYSVSDDGEIRNDSSNKIMTINKGVVQLYINKKNKRLSVGKLVAQAFIPKLREEEVYVTHIDEDVNNNKVDNLLWITAQENSNNTWKKRRENNTTGAGQKRQPKKRENIVDLTHYVLNENEERQVIIDNELTYYSINKLGQVKNLNTKKFLKGTNLHSYIYVNLTVGKKRKNRAVHQLVAQAFLPNPNNYTIVDHINGDRQDNRVENLRWASALENANNKHLDKTPDKPHFEEVKFSDEEMQSEKWKEYNGFKVSNLGRVIGKNNKILKGHKSDCGYISYGGDHILGHILVWEAFNGQKQSGMVINHINGNKHDNRLVNLEQVTPKENSRKAATETNAWGFRQVGEYDDKGNLLQIYPNASEAARAIGILPGSMRNSIRREGKCSNGLRYKYIENK